MDRSKGLTRSDSLIEEQTYEFGLHLAFITEIDSLRGKCMKDGRLHLGRRHANSGCAGDVQVSVPPMLGYKIVGLGLATFAVTFAWDHVLRAAFPAPSPPQKGYLAFKKELAVLKKQEARQQRRPHAG